MLNVFRIYIAIISQALQEDIPEYIIANNRKQAEIFKKNTMEK